MLQSDSGGGCRREHHGAFADFLPAGRVADWRARHPRHLLGSSSSMRAASVVREPHSGSARAWAGTRCATCCRATEWSPRPDELTGYSGGLVEAAPAGPGADRAAAPDATDGVITGAPGTGHRTFRRPLPNAPFAPQGEEGGVAPSARTEPLRRPAPAAASGLAMSSSDLPSASTARNHATSPPAIITAAPSR